jgi:hypothetical protein
LRSHDHASPGSHWSQRRRGWPGMTRAGKRRHSSAATSERLQSACGAYAAFVALKGVMDDANTDSTP